MTHSVNKVLNRVKRMIRSIAGRVMIARSEFEAVGQALVSTQVRLRATDGGTARLGDCVVIDRGAELTVKHGRLKIGPRSYVRQYSVICARDAISISADCLTRDYPGPKPSLRSRPDHRPSRVHHCTRHDRRQYLDLG